MFWLRQMQSLRSWRSWTCTPWCYPPSLTGQRATAENTLWSPWTLSTPPCLSVLRPVWRSCASHTDSSLPPTSRRIGSQGPCYNSDVSPGSMSAPTTTSLTMWKQVGNIQVISSPKIVKMLKTHQLMLFWWLQRFSSILWFPLEMWALHTDLLAFLHRLFTLAPLAFCRQRLRHHLPWTRTPRSWWWPLRWTARRQNATDCCWFARCRQESALPTWAPRWMF